MATSSTKTLVVIWLLSRGVKVCEVSSEEVSYGCCLSGFWKKLILYRVSYLSLESEFYSEASNFLLIYGQVCWVLEVTEILTHPIDSPFILGYTHRLIGSTQIHQ